MLQANRERWNTCRSLQAQFIQDNFLLIGYHALRGFTNTGRGITVCTVDAPKIDFKPSFHVWQFRTQFIAAEFTSPYLLEMGISSHQIASLIKAINSYEPHKEIVLAINFNQQIEILCLQNLKISPSECYKQVSDRWDDFMCDGLPPDSLHHLIDF